MPPNRRDLRRQPAKRTVKRKIFVYPEGKNTEPSYFSLIKTRCSKKVEILIKGQFAGRDPVTLARGAANQMESVRKSKHEFEKSDQVWVIFDHDGREEQFQEAISICKRAGVQTAFSNPCFEIWLILHENEYDKPCDSRQVQKDLQACFPDYDRSRSKNADFSPLLGKISAAEERAEKQIARRDEEGMPNGAPSTTVFQLTRAIAAAAEQFGGPSWTSPTGLLNCQ